MQKNLNKYPITCPNCQGVDFARSIRLEFSGAMTEKMGVLFCLDCKTRLPLDEAIKKVQLRIKREEIEAMEQELEAI